MGTPDLTPEELQRLVEEARKKTEEMLAQMSPEERAEAEKRFAAMKAADDAAMKKTLDEARKVGVVRHSPAVGDGCHRGRYPSVEDERERAAVGARLSRHILDKLFIGSKSLTSRALKPPLRRKVGVDDDEAAVHDVVSHGLKEKALAAAVLAADKAERRAAVRHDVDVVEESFYLRLTPDCDVGEPRPRDDATAERVYKSPGDSLRYLHFI